MVFVFGDFELDTDLFELRRAREPIPVEPQVFDVLRYLVEHRDRVVTKHELLDNIWGDRFVSESALTSRIKAARKALGDDGRNQEVIKTAHGRGYRFAAPVQERTGQGTATGADPDPAPAATAGPPDAPVDDGQVDTWPLIGRARDLAMLGDWFHDPQRGGVVLTGAAGMGKTRLAEEALRVAAGAGIPTLRAAGHAEAAAIPLAALAHLLPADVVEVSSDGDLDLTALFHRARAALGGPERRILLVDDVDQLDELSRAILASLVVDRTVFALVTLRAGPEPVPTIDHLVKDGHLSTMEVRPLSPTTIETLLHRALGGPVFGDTMQQLAGASLGNPGIVRHLVETALASGSLVQTRGVWTLTGPLVTSPTLEGLFADRLSDLDDEMQHAIELIAVAGEIGVDLVAELAGDRPLEDLDHRGLITVRTKGRRLDVGLAHPLYGEILRSRLPTLRARRLRRELADVVEARGARRRDDRVRLVAWRFEAGGHVDPDLLVHAARLALLDHQFDIAERMLEQARRDAPTPDVLQTLAELQFRRGNTTEVERLLSAIDLEGLPDAQRGQIIRRRATSMFLSTTEYRPSCDVLEQGLTTIDDPDTRSAIEAQLAMLLVNGGQVTESMQRSRAALAEATSPAVRLELHRALGLALVHAARPEEGLEHIREGQRLHAELGHDLSLPGLSLLLFSEVVALSAAGRVGEAREAAARLKADHPGTGTNWIDTALGRLELLAGRPVAARLALTPAIHNSRARDHGGTERWVLALHATAHIVEGHPERAAPELERVASLEDGSRGLYHSEIDRAHAWFAAATGERERAVEMVRTAAADCRSRGHTGMESALLHDLVRLGHPEEAAARLVEIAADSDGILFQARALHVRGVLDADADLLREAVDLYRHGECVLYAAEATHALAQVLEQHGDHAGAAAEAEQCEELRSSGDARLVSPALS